MILYSYKISKINIHNIHSEKDIKIEYLRLILYKHLKEFLHLVPRAYYHGILGRTRPVRTQNANSLNYMIFLHAYYAIEFCYFPLSL